MTADVNKRALFSVPLGCAPLGWAEDLRTESFTRFHQIGLPTKKTEAFKYTNLSHLEDRPYEAAPTVVPQAMPEAAPEAFSLCRIVLVNGRYAPSLSTLDALPSTVTVQSLDEAVASNDALLQSVLGQVADTETAPFAALNMANLQDGLFIRIADGCIVEHVVEILHLALPSEDEASVCHPHICISVGDGASATLLERFTPAEKGILFTNQVTETHVGEGAHFRHYVIHDQAEENTTLAHMALTVAARAQVECFTCHVGKGIARQEMNVQLQGPYADCLLDGAYHLTGNAHADNTILMDHAAPDTRSGQTIKGVLGGKGRAVFQSKILVRKDSQHIDGNQLHKAMLLSPEAEVDAKPELEIYADDVKCSHGTTVGALDPEQLFYLRSRGLSQEEAQNLLIDGFLDDVVSRVSSERVRILLQETLHPHKDQ